LTGLIILYSSQPEGTGSQSLRCPAGKAADHLVPWPTLDFGISGSEVRHRGNDAIVSIIAIVVHYTIVTEGVVSCARRPCKIDRLGR
jgi:hypothetical protein